MAQKLMNANAWMFDHEPKADEITPLLESVPAWHGAPEDKTMADYQGYVIAIKQFVGERGQKVPMWRLYTTVAGKVAILHDAHRDENGNQVPVEEEVQYEFKNGLVIIHGTMHSPLYGTRYETGTGVTGDGASGADLTNPIENAMTSWRGRAASALCGAGVLPYTGIASAEEVQSAEHRNDMAERGYRVVSTESTTPPQSKPKPQAHEKTIEDSNIETLKRIQKVSNSELEAYIIGYCKANEIEYTEPIMDWFKEQPVTFCNPINAFIKEQRS